MMDFLKSRKLSWVFYYLSFKVAEAIVRKSRLLSLFERTLVSDFRGRIAQLLPRSQKT